MKKKKKEEGENEAGQRQFPSVPCHSRSGSRFAPIARSKIVRWAEESPYHTILDSNILS